MNVETPGGLFSRINKFTWLAIWLLFLALFWSLPSRDYMAVDGALRCLGVYYDRSLLFHANNHLLYPFWISRWSFLAGAVGIKASNAFEFVRISQAMNGFLAAATVAILYTILRLLTIAPIALLCSLVFGFSTAFLLHATNSAEPMAGLFFSLLGIRALMEGLLRNSRFILFASGICFAIALASYQAMGVIAGLGAFACFWWSSIRPNDRRVFGFPLSLFWVAVGGLAGLSGIYGLAYSLQGIPLSRMPRQFFALAGSEIYSGFTLPRLLNIPFGLVRSWLGDGPDAYAGIRSLLYHPQRAFWIPAVLTGVITAAAMLFLSLKALWRLSRKRPRAPKLAAFAAVALLCFPLAYWDPGYNKLWLLPLAAMIAAIAVSLRPTLLLPRERLTLLSLLAIAFCAEITVNLPKVFHSHFTAAPHLEDAESINRFVTPRDWIVLDFDDVSILWSSFWGHDFRYLLLPSSTPASAKHWLAEAERASSQTNARIFFVGVLDQDRNTWDNFLGKRVGIPFDFLKEFRQNATILDSFELETGSITLRAYSCPH